MADIISEAPNPLMERLVKEKGVANEFQKRRHEDWEDNYTLYRNKVKTNRLTQRQAVNIPLMKETVKTILSKIDEVPTIKWTELSGDEDKEIVLQEMWDTKFQEDNFEGIDMQDKKTVMLYGRGFKKLNLIDGEFKINALDIYDVVVDPLVDPLEMETAKYIVHQNIYKSLREILASDRYTKAGKEKLKTYLLTNEGILQSSEEKEKAKEKQERLVSMGVESDEFDTFGAGDTIINLTEHFTNTWDKKEKKFVRYVYIYAFENILLLEEKLEDLIGVNFWPFVSWGEDVETQDIWSDGPADLVRIPNKVLNVWFSQMIENRTLKNFQMHWYDATKQGYVPQTYEPGPGRMLPAPGKPQDTIMPLEISGLEDTLTQIDFLIKLVEKGTSATAIEKGVQEKKQTTLGEIQISVGKAMERMLSMRKFYARAWQELAMKWYRMMEANPSGKMTLYKISTNGKVWPKDIYNKDWKSKAGYKAEFRSTSEQEEDNLKNIQKWTYIKNQFPTNQAVQKIVQRRMLEIVSLTPQELKEIEEAEKKMEQVQAMTPATPGQPAQPQSQPQQPQQSPEEIQMANQLQKSAGELANLQV